MELNALASSVSAGSDGVIVLPFGNGAERIFNNKKIGSHILNINFNRHSQAHLVLAAMEGIAFAFNYGLKIMKDNGIQLQIVKAPKANLFLSEVFIEAFVNTTGLTVELYEVDGSVGAAKGAAIGVLGVEKIDEILIHNKPIEIYNPNVDINYQSKYEKWEAELMRFLH